MKKLYSFIALCVATLGFTTASAQIANLSELSNDKCYTVKNVRSSWVVSEDNALKTVRETGIDENAEDPNQQFAFLTNDEGETYYLYSVGKEQFVNLDGSLSATAVNPVLFKNGSAAGTFIIYFDGDHHVNVGGSGNIEINWWGSADDGNSNQIFIADTFDATEALKAIPAPAEDPAIKSIEDLSNNKLYTVVQEGRGTSWAIAEGGEALTSSNQVGDVVVGQADDTKQQFAFITYAGNTYIYHAAEKKFVNKDGALADLPTDPVMFEKGVGKRGFVILFDDQHYVNINNEKNVAINGWSTADDGNSCRITPVANFDPSEVLALFEQTTAIESATVVGKADVYSLDGRKVQNPSKGIYLINRKKVYVK